jgi:hypothetical protein
MSVAPAAGVGLSALAPAAGGGLSALAPPAGGGLPTLAPAASGGLPAVAEAREPAWVRHGSAATQRSYATALAFEGMLVQQLAKTLAATSGLDGESGEAGAGGEAGATGVDAGSSALSAMLPQALASGVMSAGGLGLAAQLTHQLEGLQPHARTDAASGGTRA